MVKLELSFRLWRMKGAIIGDQKVKSVKKARKNAGLKKKIDETKEKIVIIESENISLVEELRKKQDELIEQQKREQANIESEKERQRTKIEQLQLQQRQEADAELDLKEELGSQIAELQRELLESDQIAKQLERDNEEKIISTLKKHDEVSIKRRGEINEVLLEFAA